MIPLTVAPPALSPDLCLYYATDPLLENLPVLIFYGPSTTGNSTLNTSRIQIHVFSLAGVQSFPRLTISPTSPLYAAVNHLPSDFQGDEVARGLAVGLLSYFAALSNETKDSLRTLAGSRRPKGVAPMMFDEMHAGGLAANMEQMGDSCEVSHYLTNALSQQMISWLDMDVTLPTGTIKQSMTFDGSEPVKSFNECGSPLFDYGSYDPLLKILGTPAFLPTSKLKRAPSRPTTHSKSRVLSKDAKISLRREMCELVDTEKSYLDKLSDLVNKMVATFREESASGDVDALFPASLDQILELSTGFYDELQSTLDGTEDEAIRDIEGLITTESRTESNDNPSRRRDPTGATAFAKALLAWFPKFQVPYQDYLRASNRFAKIIGEGLSDTSSPTWTRLNEIGEQRLRSALIEPVQRLPRYNLLIDNMINLLPSLHPSLPSFLKARDVITDICALDASVGLDGSRFSRTMSTIVQDWPASLSLKGRLIAAVDVVELDPPFEPSGNGNPGILLLFPDRLVLLDKLSDSALTARGLLAEVDRPIMQAHTDLYHTNEDEKTLSVSESFELAKSQFTESHGGRVVHMTDFASAHQAIHSTIHFKVFSLQGPYEGKASRFSEEIAKARVEGRYTEAIRDSGKWALHTIAEPEKLSIVAALSEKSQFQGVGYQKSHGHIHLFIGDTMPARNELDSKISIRAHISTNDFLKYHLAVEGPNKKPYKIECNLETVIPFFLKQLDVTCRREHEQFMDYHISYYRSLLNNLPIRKEQAETKHHSRRPISPIKMLSKVFGNDGTPSRNPSKPDRNAPIMKSLPRLPQLTPTTEQAVDPNPKGSGSKVTLVDSNAETYKSPLALLEDTFIAYVVALHSRSGNVVGKILRNRATADELSINELYNTLLEDPSRIQMAAEVSVDVLFAAFEKFLRVAWRERMGPLIAPMAMQNLQSSFDTGRPTAFVQDFKNLLEEMSPQSRRCFAATVKLLSELLDASGNDGDRGVLMASFAEALVLVGNPHEYITLLDRLVDDYDHLFEGDIEKPGSSGSATGSLTGTRSVNAGSLSSNTSSLRRKFGLGGGGGLSRENSKNEPESKVASIWRNLSKNARSPGESQRQGFSQPGSISKASLVRSRSTDTAPRMLLPFRPDSRDRPPTSGSGVSDEARSRPGSSHNTITILTSIGEGAPNNPTILPKKKRRSSLSDLVKAQQSVPSPPFSPLQPRRLPITPSATTAKTLPRTPSPRKSSLTNRFDKPSPPGSKLPQCLGSPRRKENSPLRSLPQSKENSPTPCSAQSRRYKLSTPEAVNITSYSPQKRTTSRSNIPTPKTGGLSERVWPPNGDNSTPPKKSATGDGSPKKLRMQSPQKIRERLSQERKAMDGTERILQDEINQIAEEMSTFKLRAPTISAASSGSKSQRETLESLSMRLDAQSKSLQSFATTHTATTNKLRIDLESSLLVADKRARKLDELYTEANAENEALYERFNDELGKILGRVRKGEGVGEMRDRMNEALKEVASLKREKAKLKREVAGLRSMVKP